jgi:hypothetical protein
MAGLKDALSRVYPVILAEIHKVFAASGETSDV